VGRGAGNLSNWLLVRPQCGPGVVLGFFSCALRHHPDYRAHHPAAAARRRLRLIWFGVVMSVVMEWGSSTAAASISFSSTNRPRTSSLGDIVWERCLRVPDDAAVVILCVLPETPPACPDYVHGQAHAPLSAFEFRLALAEERTDSFLEVLGVEIRRSSLGTSSSVSASFLGKAVDEFLVSVRQGARLHPTRRCAVA